MGTSNTFIRTDDNIKIACDHYRNGSERVVIIAHGFGFNKDIPLMREVADTFSHGYDVITFDFRGHGKSSDFFTWTALEDRDLRAVVEHARGDAYKKIAVLGFSLGGAISIIEASYDRNVDNLMIVSAPCDLAKIRFRIWEQRAKKDIELHLSPREKGKKVRPGNPFIAKIKPIDVVQKIAPRPILFIHGEQDWLVGTDHSQKLFQKAGEPKRIEIIRNAGHAENIFVLFPHEFQNICIEWLKKTF